VVICLERGADDLHMVQLMPLPPPSSLASLKSRLVLANIYAIALPSVVCMSSVCNARAPYSGGSNFRQYFYGIRCLGHPLTSTENFTEIVPGEPFHWGS